VFQSTPGINAGRIARWVTLWRADLSFNPRPALMPGESYKDLWNKDADHWFQSTPGINAGRIGHDRVDPHGRSVSIHARH